MKKKKNSFFAFCFSLIPGACHMYIGFMKQGISIMLLLVANICLAGVLNLAILTVFIPILWFYSFFDVHNKRSLSEEELNALEDKFVFNGIHQDEIVDILKGKARPIIAGVLIFIGFYILYENIMGWLVNLFPISIFQNFYYSVLRKMPQVVIAIVIIYIGFRLIVGKKNEMLSSDIISENTERNSMDTIIYAPSQDISYNSFGEENNKEVVITEIEIGDKYE